MRLIQSVKDGHLRFENTPQPTPGVTQILVQAAASLISSGTERSVRSLASASLAAKAKARPDLVREVIRRARTQGVVPTARAVRERLNEYIPLGYSAAGIVMEVGEAARGVRPGDRVATAGAPHADFQAVPGNLVVLLPDSIPFEDGAFVTVSVIAMNGLRLAEIQPGAKVLIVGLGLVGQLAARLAMASGAEVAGIDPIEWKRAKAHVSGVATFPADSSGWSAAIDVTKGTGFDAVIVTAATQSSEPMVSASSAARDHGIVVLIGEAGLDLDRRPLYERELTVRVARSYGPGRYDPVYEELGVDYPVGGVRWTAQRNMEAVVSLLASKRLVVSDLITHRVPFASAPDAYALLEDDSAQYVGIILKYESETQPKPSLEFANSERKAVAPDLHGAGLIGAGRFARSVLLPAATAAGFGGWTIVSSASGSGAANVAEEHGFKRATTDSSTVISDPATRIVFVVSRHDSHADYTRAALEAGKHVFCEKPVAITEKQLDEVAAAYGQSEGTLMVGLNRRWSPAIQETREILRDASSPVQLIYRVNAGSLPPAHWLKDRRMGGRLLGEATHFIDTCNAIVDAVPRTVLTLTSGGSELLLDDDFTIVLSYPDGSQAVIVYASNSATQPGKERLEVLGSGRSIIIVDYATLTAYGPSGRVKRRYRPADKGHRRELEVFAELVRGERNPDEIAAATFSTSRVAFAAIRSAMSGRVIRLKS